MNAEFINIVWVLHNRDRKFLRLKLIKNFMGSVIITSLYAFYSEHIATWVFISLSLHNQSL